MRKVVTIEDCEDCPFVYLYLGVDEQCLLKDYKPIPLDDDNPIPKWCPLMDAPEDIIKLEDKLRGDAGYTYE